MNSPIQVNSKFRSIFLENINKEYSYVICCCQSYFMYTLGEIAELSNYRKFELLGLGHNKREEIIKKWISLGVEENIDDEDLYKQCDEVKSRLDTVIKKNIVPKKPIYILMLLQMFEAQSPLNLELTSYGHCYQQLIYQSFDKAKIEKTDFEKYMNVLTELAWHIFNLGEHPDKTQLNLFLEKYCENYLTINGHEIIETLIQNSILERSDDKTGFKYQYIYYFFVGKKIAEAYSDSQDVKDAVGDMLQDIHRENYANILIFITHHTKEPWVLSEIKGVLKNLFVESEQASLTKLQLSFMQDFLKQIPELVIEQREIQKEREKHNKKLDELERRNEEKTEDLEVLANINKAFKGMEITGQVIRNRHATLKRDAIYELAQQGASTGLRFLGYFIKISDEAKNEIIQLIASHLAEEPDVTDKEIKEHAEEAYVHLIFNVINASIRKISSSIGSKEALEIYVQIENNEDSPAYTLIRQAIELQFTRQINIESISKTVDKLANNPTCLRILKEIVVQHIPESVSSF
uniref:Toll-interleukin receptor n=1 Tax=Magnetococcus massalia (strain MO-1) TaxID=451514 RepID=A0A1S7LE78_MAGMO